MAHFLIALKAIAPLFLIIFTGIVFSRTRAASGNWVDILNKYALWIGFPALVIASLIHLENNGQSFSRLIFINSAYVVACMLLAFPLAWVFRLGPKTRSTLFLVLSFGNVAYLGIPVLQSAYGEQALPVAAILSAVYVFILLTLGIVLIEVTSGAGARPRKLLLDLVRNPLLLSVLVGIALAMSDISLPGFIVKTIDLFAGSVTAIVLFSLGIFLGQNKIGHPREWIKVAMWVVLTMIVLPGSFLLISQSCGLPELHFKSMILDAAMPLGLTPYALSVQYRLESTLTARIVVLGTLLSVVLIPMWIAILG